MRPKYSKKKKQRFDKQTEGRHNAMKTAKAEAEAKAKEPVEGNFEKELSKIDRDLDDLLD